MLNMYFRKNFLSLVAALFLFSCASHEKKTEGGFTKESSFSELFSFEAPPLEYILAHCKIYGLNDGSAHNIEANECAFPKDGEQLIYKRYYLDAFDRQNKKLWTIQNLSLHHQIELANAEKEILLMDWDYWKDSDKVCYRFDRLIVLNRQGKQLQSLSFKDLLSSGAAVKKKLKADNEGVCEKAFRDVKRMSRVTLFRSLKAKDLSVAGYFTFDAANSVFYIFGKDLKVKKSISFAGRLLQSPEQIAEDKIVFYEIVKNESGNTQQARLVTLDLNTEETSVVYESPVNIANTDFCGGLTYRGDHTLFVSHSDCTLGKDSTADLKIELLDLNMKTKLKEFSLPKLTPYGVQPFYPPAGFWDYAPVKK